MSEITTAMISKKIKNYEFPFCQAEEEHSHHHCTEICLSRSCIACFKPMCYHCKFENHSNGNSDSTPKPQITQIDCIPKYRNLAKSDQFNMTNKKIDNNLFGKDNKSVKSKSDLDEEYHQVHPIKWVLTSLNQQIEHHEQMSGNQENDLWDQTEQDLKNVIDYSQRLKEKITQLQEGAEMLMERYALLKRQSERDERVKLVQEIINDLLDDNSMKNLQKQLKALRKYIFVEKKGKITIMGEQEMLKLEKEKTEMQENIDKYVQILQATYDEVQECLIYSHEIIKSDQHGMSWFKKFDDTNVSQLINSSMMTATKINSLSKGQVQNFNNNNEVSIKSVLLKNSQFQNQSEYSFTSDGNTKNKRGLQGSSNIY